MGFSAGKRRPSDDHLPAVTEILAKPDALVEQPSADQLGPTLPDEERELISAIFSSDEIEAEPANMYAL
jgi:hypothetical protein